MEGRFGRLELRRTQQQTKPQPTHGLSVRGADHHYASACQARSWGDHEQALRLYTRTLGEDRGRVAAWCGQVQMLVQLREYDEALLWADKALEVFPYQGDLMACRAQACARLGDRRNAMACSDTSLTAPGSSAWRWEARGETLLACNKPRHDECFERAACEPDFDWFDYVLIAEILEHYGRLASAMKQIHLALSKRPDHGYNWYVLGRCQQGLGWTGAARQSYSRALELAPHFRPARSSLAAAGRLGPLARLLIPLRIWRHR
jgi:tetratricopeptide (TPR) repeat protein